MSTSPDPRRPSIWVELWRRPPARLGLILLAGLSVIALAGPLLAPYGAEQCVLEEELAAPSLRHWFGADPDGCDIFSRILIGSRISLSVGLGVVAVSASLGTLIGTLAGWFGGRTDRALMFVLECFQAFPGILLAIAITAIYEDRSIGLTIFALCVAGWVGYARLARGQVLALREREYIQAARALGVPLPRLLLRHVLPNIASPIVVQATFGMAAAIMAEAGLSFLGLGAPPGTPSWGAMLNEGRSYMLSAPHLSVYPGVAIGLTVLAFNFVGDGLRDALDPRRRR